MTSTERNGNRLSCQDAIEFYSDFIGVPFSDFLSESELESISNTVNKGVLGQFFELTLGKRLDNASLDFSDGELKTYTSDAEGLVPSGGTICLTNIGSAHVDEMLDLVPFRDAWCSRKLSHTVFIGICKPDDEEPSSWFVSAIHDCDFAHNPKLAAIAEQLQSEYEELCLRSLELVVETGHLGGCAAGLRYVEHRPKQSGSISSKLCGGAVVYGKQKALYLKRHFVTDIAAALAA